MANWKNIGLVLGKGLLASQGIPLDQIINRPKRRRRRRERRELPDIAALAVAFREVLQDELSDRELEEVDSAIVWLAQLIIEERQEDVVEEEEDDNPGMVTPRRKRRRKTPKKKAKKEKK